jgi:hypothetical protein
MRRIELAVLFSISLLTARPIAGAEPEAKPHHIGILTSDAEQDPRVVEVRRGLRDLGYVEGRTLSLNIGGPTVTWIVSRHLPLR